MTDTKLPPPGWYEDDDGIGERWWDGKEWTDHRRSTAGAAPGRSASNTEDATFADKVFGEGGLLEEMPAKAKDYYRRNKEDVQTAAGAGMIADGLVGLEMPGRGDRRPGIGKALVGVVLGLVFVIAGFVIRGFISVPDDWIETEGTVTDIRYNRDGMCAPVAEYAVNGEIHTVRSSAYSSPCRASIGAPIAVFYDPSSPASAQIDGGLLAWTPWMFIGVGAVIAVSSLVTFVIRALTLGAGIALLLKGRRGRRTKQVARGDAGPASPIE